MANRVTQEAVEGVLSPTTGHARSTQEVVEAVVSPTSGRARTTSLPVEVVVGGDPPMRTTQAPLEVVYATLPAAPAEGAFAEAVIALSPWVYWKLGDPGSQAWDHSGNDRHGVYIGSPLQEQPGALVADDDGAVHFDAVDDYLRPEAAVFNAAALTMMCFFEYNGTPPGALSLIAGCADGVGSPTNSGVLSLLANGKAEFYVYDGGPKFATSPLALTTGWHMLVGRVGGGTIDFWLDGVEVASAACGAAFASYTVPNVLVGGATADKPRRAGKRDEFALWNAALGDADIELLWELSQQEAPAGGGSSPVLGDPGDLYMGKPHGIRVSG